MQVNPIDLVELVKAVFYGVAALCVPVATVYIMITANRTKELNTKIDGMLVDRDAANVSKGERRGERAGRETAETLAEGQRQGREAERASSIARGIEHGAPLPVEDEAAAAIATRGVEATERLADATERKS